MEQSIFRTIKKMLGFDYDYNVFDLDIKIQINSALSILTQLGVGPKEGFRISGESETWESYLGDRKDLEMIKDYIYLKVRHKFDPPSSSSVLTSIENEIKEMEWRINVAVDPEVQNE